MCWKFLAKRFLLENFFNYLYFDFFSRKNSQLCHCNRRSKFHAEVEATIKEKKIGNKLEKIPDEKWDQISHTKPHREAAHGRLTNDAWVFKKQHYIFQRRNRGF